MNKQFQKLAAIAATILIITTLSACNRASDNNENNDNSELNEIELLTIEELAPLNTKVKNGETTPEETIEIYKKMITRNLKDEGKDILAKGFEDIFRAELIESCSSLSEYLIGLLKARIFHETAPPRQDEERRLQVRKDSIDEEVLPAFQFLHRRFKGIS